MFYPANRIRFFQPKRSFGPSLPIWTLLLSAICLAGTLLAQPGHTPKALNRYQFPDILELRAHITDTADVARSFFSDCGAWHAYGLPERPEDRGGFTGPLIMGMDGRWLASSMARLQILEDGKTVDLSTATASLHYYPGLLRAVYQAGQLEIIQQLIFVSGREARIRTSIRNRSIQRKVLQLSFTGQTLLANTRLRSAERGLTVDLESDKQFLVRYDRKPESIAVGDRSYTTHFRPVVLPPAGTVFLDQSQSYFPAAEDAPSGRGKARTSTGRLPINFPRALAANEHRWNSYLASVLPTASRLAVKALITLTTNWRSAAGDLKHDGVFPSASYQGFYGMWSWDSWKQAVALVYFNPALARDNIRCLFDYQDSAGMVPDCVYMDKKENNFRDTKPPLAAWAVWKVYQHTMDRKFLAEMYPRLVKYHRWWYTYRDNNNNGLCEYGSTDGTRIAAAWESGMDNAVRFDSARMIHHGGNAWSLDQESVDLNAYLYAEKLFLARIAESLFGSSSGGPGAGGRGRLFHPSSREWRQEAAILKEKTNRQFYSQDRGYYYDYHTDLRQLILTEGPEGWIPLWAGIPDRTRAAGTLAMMRDTAKFNTFLPLPTLAADHPRFNPANGYWRGPVWLDQFYFGIEGLRYYGYHKKADSLVSKFFRHAEGLWDKGTIRENYHPLTGQGLNALNFSWSAAFILLLLQGEKTSN